MDLNRLHEVINLYRAFEYAHDRDPSEGLFLFLNYATFGELRAQVHRGYLFNPEPHNNPHVFMFMGVAVSWSPAVTQPSGYAYGRETLK